MTFTEFNRKLLEIGRQGTEGAEFVTHIWNIMDMLDEADCEDYFGTQGWKYQAGLED